MLEADPAAGTLRAVRRITAADPLLPLPSAGAAGALRLPETLIIEALCQAAACLNGLAAPGPHPPHLGYLAGISDFVFHAPVSVGETLLLSVRRGSRLGALVSFDAEASTAGQVRIAQGRLLFAVPAP